MNHAMPRLTLRPLPPLLTPRRTALLLAAALSACTSTAPTRPPNRPAAAQGPQAPATTVVAAPPAAPQPQAPAPPPELAPEARWLQDWFGATPVKVALDEQGLVRLHVPAAHAFASGAPAPKPALKAVLDRVVQSLGRKPNAKVAVTVPAGVPGREAAVRSHLTGQGVAAWRVSVQAGTGGADAATEIVVSPGQAPVRRVEDDKLPPPPAPTPKPVKPVPPRAAASR